MALFSERFGYKKISDQLQIESMNDTLKICIWNLLHIFYWKQIRTTPYHYIDKNACKSLNKLLSQIWLHHFKIEFDLFEQQRWSQIIQKIKKIFKEYNWYQVYELIEFIIQNYDDSKINDSFKKALNTTLETELSAYRIAGQQFVKITTQIELNELDQTMNSPYDGINDHIKTSANFLFDKKNPDYRNSIKESISAVECACRIVLDNEKIILSDALKAIESKANFTFHPAFKQAFEKLYAFTNDEKGIRHSLLDNDRLTREDAQFFLIACSAFVNFMISKISSQ